jgi:hypothetical protein
MFGKDKKAKGTGSGADLWGASKDSDAGTPAGGIGGNALAGVGMNLAGALAPGGMHRMGKKPGFSLFSKKPKAKATIAPPRPSTPAPELPRKGGKNPSLIFDDESSEIEAGADKLADSSGEDADSLDVS